MLKPNGGNPSINSQAPRRRFARKGRGEAVGGVASLAWDRQEFDVEQCEGNLEIRMRIPLEKVVNEQKPEIMLLLTEAGPDRLRQILHDKIHEQRYANKPVVSLVQSALRGPFFDAIAALLTEIRDMQETDYGRDTLESMVKSFREVTQNHSGPRPSVHESLVFLKRYEDIHRKVGEWKGRQGTDGAEAVAKIIETSEQNLVLKTLGEYPGEHEICAVLCEHSASEIAVAILKSKLGAEKRAMAKSTLEKRLAQARAFRRELKKVTPAPTLAQRMSQSLTSEAEALQSPSEGTEFCRPASPECRAASTS